MPFYLGTPKVDEGVMIFNWDEAYDFSAQDITYHFELSRNWEFTDIVYETTVSNLISIETDILKPGTYFWRVTAINEVGKTQIPFDNFFDSDSHLHYGMKSFSITPNGQVIE